MQVRATFISDPRVGVLVDLALEVGYNRPLLIRGEEVVRRQDGDLASARRVDDQVGDAEPRGVALEVMDDVEARLEGVLKCSTPFTRSHR